MSQMNPKEAFQDTAYSVQLPYIAGHSLQLKKHYFMIKCFFCALGEINKRIDI